MLITEETSGVVHENSFSSTKTIFHLFSIALKYSLFNSLNPPCIFACVDLLYSTDLLMSQ